MKKNLNYLIKAILAILLISLYQCQLPRFINLESGMAMGAETCIVRYKPNIALTSKNAQIVFDEHMVKSVQYLNNSYED